MSEDSSPASASNGNDLQRNLPCSSIKKAPLRRWQRDQLDRIRSFFYHHTIVVEGGAMTAEARIFDEEKEGESNVGASLDQRKQGQQYSYAENTQPQLDPRQDFYQRLVADSRQYLREHVQRMADAEDKVADYQETDWKFGQSVQTIFFDAESDHPNHDTGVNPESADQPSPGFGEAIKPSPSYNNVDRNSDEDFDSHLRAVQDWNQNLESATPDNMIQPGKAEDDDQPCTTSLPSQEIIQEASRVSGNERNYIDLTSTRNHAQEARTTPLLGPNEVPLVVLSPVLENSSPKLKSSPVPLSFCLSEGKTRATLETIADAALRSRQCTGSYSKDSTDNSLLHPMSTSPEESFMAKVVNSTSQHVSNIQQNQNASLQKRKAASLDSEAKPPASKVPKRSVDSPTSPATGRPVDESQQLRDLSTPTAGAATSSPQQSDHVNQSYQSVTLGGATTGIVTSVVRRPSSPSDNNERGSRQSQSSGCTSKQDIRFVEQNVPLPNDDRKQKSNTTGSFMGSLLRKLLFMSKANTDEPQHARALTTDPAARSEHYDLSSAPVYTLDSENHMDAVNDTGNPRELNMNIETESSCIPEYYPTAAQAPSTASYRNNESDTVHDITILSTQSLPNNNNGEEERLEEGEESDNGDLPARSFPILRSTPRFKKLPRKNRGNRKATLSPPPNVEDAVPDHPICSRSVHWSRHSPSDLVGTSLISLTRLPSSKSRFCHACKNNTYEYRICQYWTFSKCGKSFCRTCLEKDYGQTQEWSTLLNDDDWHCPSCLKICHCVPCSKLRFREMFGTVSQRKLRRL